MDNVDKVILLEKLLKLGWEAVPGEGRYMVTPPPDFFEKGRKVFHVYDARALQDIIGTGENDLWDE